MPELPDVEAYKRYLDAKALGQTIEHAHCSAPRLLQGTTPQGLGWALVHHHFTTTRRHGKYLFAGLDTGRWLALHFGMTGRLEYFKRETNRPRYTQFLIGFANGFHLAYAAPRKLGQIALIGNPQAFVEQHGLGPDALAVGLGDFAALAAKRRGGVKGWLLDQAAIAGIGNVYGDEILFQARLHPRQKASDLTRREIERLHRKMRHVLDHATRAQADPARMPDSWLMRHRGKDGRCPRCGSHPARTQVAGRTAWYCPRCQRQPRSVVCSGEQAYCRGVLRVSQPIRDSKMAST